MKKLLTLFCLSILAASFFSCEKEVEKLVEVDRIVKDTVYVNKKDTIYIDKIVRDTIVNNIHDTLYVDKIVKDTIILSVSNIPAELKTFIDKNKTLYADWCYIAKYEYILGEYAQGYSLFFGKRSYSYSTPNPVNNRLIFLIWWKDKIYRVTEYDVVTKQKVLDEKAYLGSIPADYNQLSNPYGFILRNAYIETQYN